MTNNRRFVFDTNVLISAFLFSQSKPRQALKQAQNIGVIVLSISVLSELKEVLYRPKFDKYLTLERRQDGCIPVFISRSTNKIYDVRREERSNPSRCDCFVVPPRNDGTLLYLFMTSN